MWQFSHAVFANPQAVAIQSTPPSRHCEAAGRGNPVSPPRQHLWIASRRFIDITTQFLLSDKSLAVIDQEQEISFSNSSLGCVVSWECPCGIAGSQRQYSPPRFARGRNDSLGE